MAFSATVRNVQYMGPCKTIVTGDWSGSAGDSAGLFTVSGVVTSSRFQKFDSDQTYSDVRCSSSITSGITTITVNNQDNVSTGYFTIEKLG